MRRGFAAAVLLLLALAVLAGAGLWSGGRLVQRPGPLAQPADVVVPRGATAAIAAGLQDAGVIDHPALFRAAALVTRAQGPLRAAEFAFPAHASIADVLHVLRTAKPVQHMVTLPEGLTAVQLAEILNRADALAGTIQPPAEGALLPQTYAYERGTPRAALLRRAETAMDRALAEVWDKRAPGLPLAGPHDALILASIVEHETPKPEERPHIAAVFLNRLRLGMKLQSDPTVIYGITQGRTSSGFGLGRKLTRADLEADNPYNTYLHAGLPPGPVDSPGLAALQAVTQPSASGDLYFVADGSGGHAFAETLEAHDRNVQRYRALMNKDGAQADPAAPLPAAAPAPSQTAPKTASRHGNRAASHHMGRHH